MNVGGSIASALGAPYLSCFSKENFNISATVVWDRSEGAVFSKPPGWEVYGAHTTYQLSLDCSLLGTLRSQGFGALMSGWSPSIR